MEGTTVVDLDGVVAVLGGYPALAGVTLTIAAGEIVLLRGPNGAGKTTLLRVCAGLLPIARGTGTVLGCDLAGERDEVRRRVGLLGHRNGLYLDLTVTENVRFWGATIGATSAEIDAAMQRLGLSGRLADLPVRSLSAGQQRRTALGMPRRPAGPAVAARRAARRPRRRWSRRARRHAAPGCGVRRDRGRGQPRARTGRVAGHPLHRCRRRPGRRARRAGSRWLTGAPLGRAHEVTSGAVARRCSSPARTCASSGAAASRSTRSSRSPPSSW